MWISFKCERKQDYLIKVYVGGANAISGESVVEDAGTRLRRQAKQANSAASLQDYIVVPGQPWLDGIANSGGTVRQLVAMPFGSVESQITGKDAASGLQIKITPYKPHPKPVYSQVSSVPQRSIIKDGDHLIYIRTLTGKIVELNVDANETIDCTKARIYIKEGVPPD